MIFVWGTIGLNLSNQQHVIIGLEVRLVGLHVLVVEERRLLLLLFDNLQFLQVGDLPLQALLAELVELYLPVKPKKNM